MNVNYSETKNKQPPNHHQIKKTRELVLETMASFTEWVLSLTFFHIFGNLYILHAF